MSGPSPQATGSFDTASLSLVGLLFLGLAPVAVLCWEAAATALLGSSELGSQPLLDTRSGGLLLRSLGISVGATAIALGAGMPIGLVLARVQVAGRRMLGATLYAAFCVSPYIVAVGWLGGGLQSESAANLLGNASAVALILGSAYAPLAALLIALGARALPLALEEAALITAAPTQVLARILIPQLLPVLGIAGLLVFVLSFSDYAVASLLQVPTYPIEVFLGYAGSYDPGQAALACVPLIAVGLVVSGALAALLPRSLLRSWPAQRAREWPLPRSSRGGALAAVFIVATFCFSAPVAGLLGALPTTDASLTALRSGMPAMWNSLCVAALAAGLALFLGTFASARLAAMAPAHFGLLAAALLVPLCVPASAYAIAWTQLTANLGTAYLDASEAVPPLNSALCLAFRLAGPVALVLAAARLSLPRDLLDAARLQERRPWRIATVIEFPLLAPIALGATAVMAGLALNATGVMVLTVPPGFEVLPLRVDNLIHYGEQGQSIALALFTAAVAAGLPLALLAASEQLRRRREL